jgi:tetratricopeptide (TPR) repeat protein
MAGFTIGVVEHDYETAIDAIDRSLALSPSSALALGFSSILRAWTGDDATSIRHAQTGIRLSPYDPLIYLPYVGLTYAYYFTGRFDEALTAAGRASQANPRFSVPCVFQTAALASRDCTACGFWDTRLNPTQRRQQFEASSAEIGLA